MRRSGNSRGNNQGILGICVGDYPDTSRQQQALAMKTTWLLILIIVSLLLWYFFVHSPTHDAQIQRPLIYSEKRRYALEFSFDKVRPSPGENRAFGYGSILLHNDTQSSSVCWSFSAIGLIKYIDSLNIHGPLHGTGESGITSEVFIQLDTTYNNDRYESCVIETSTEHTTNNLMHKINQIYDDPSRYYILASTISKPNGALWSNFGGEWHV